MLFPEIGLVVILLICLDWAKEIAPPWQTPSCIPTAADFACGRAVERKLEFARENTILANESNE